MKSPSEIVAYYEHFSEESRLQSDVFRLEFERTKEILSRLLPRRRRGSSTSAAQPVRTRVWLADQGYECTLSLVAMLTVEQILIAHTHEGRVRGKFARKPIKCGRRTGKHSMTR